MKPIKIPIPATHEEWMQNRQKGLGGSDAGAILGLNPYKSAYTLWAEKSGLIDGQVPDNEAMRIGRDLEDYVAKRFTEATGKKVRRSGFSFQNPDHPFMIGNVDRLIVGEKAGLECKTASALNRTDFEGGDIQPSYYAQCYHYMAITGLDRWYIAILVMGKGFFWHCIERDETEIEALIEAEEEFWQMIQDGKPPALDWSDSTKKTIEELYPDVDPDAKEDLSFMENQLIERTELDSQIKELEKRKKTIENSIRAELGTAGKGICPGYSISYKPSTRESIDLDKLREEWPEVAEDCKKITESRTLRISKLKEKKK